MPHWVVTCPCNPHLQTDGFVINSLSSPPSPPPPPPPSPSKLNISRQSSKRCQASGWGLKATQARQGSVCRRRRRRTRLGRRQAGQHGPSPLAWARAGSAASGHRRGPGAAQGRGPGPAAGQLQRAVALPRCLVRRICLERPTVQRPRLIFHLQLRPRVLHPRLLFWWVPPLERPTAQRPRPLFHLQLPPWALCARRLFCARPPPPAPLPRPRLPPVSFSGGWAGAGRFELGARRGAVGIGGMEEGWRE